MTCLYFVLCKTHASDVNDAVVLAALHYSGIQVEVIIKTDSQSVSAAALTCFDVMFVMLRCCCCAWRSDTAVRALDCQSTASLGSNANAFVLKMSHLNAMLSTAPRFCICLAFESNTFALALVSKTVNFFQMPISNANNIKIIHE